MKAQILSTTTILLLLGNVANANIFTSSSSSSSSSSNLEIRESNTSLRGGRARPHKATAANAPPSAEDVYEKRLAERRKRQKIKQLQNHGGGGGGRKKDTDKPPKRERPNNKKNQYGKQRPNKKNQNDGKKNNNKPDNNNKGKRPNGKKPGKKQNDKKKNSSSVVESGHRYPDRARIIGGSPANGIKYAASLQDDQGHFCGGSIITATSILTAAHCKGGQYNVGVGRDKWDSNTGQKIRMSKEVPHPQYDDYTTDSDYMVVHLSEPIDMSQSNVAFVKLNQQSATPAKGEKVTVVGWGVKNASGAGGVSDQLMQVSVNVISNDECDASGDNQDNYNGQITSNMLCAKVNGGGKDSCQGDSGGPLTNPAGHQVGVVSWGVGCAEPNFPGVYARVSKAYDWIEKTVCDNNAEHAKEAGFDCDNASFTPSSTSGSSSSGGSSGGGGSYQPSGNGSWGGNDDDDYSSSSFIGKNDDDYSWGGTDDDWSQDDDDYDNYKPSGGNNWFMDDDDYDSYKPAGGGNNNNHDDYYSFSAYDWGGNDDRPSNSRYDDDFDWDWDFGQDDWGNDYDDWW